MSQFLYGANIRANDIRQHYLRFGGASGERSTRDPVIIIPGITSPAVTWAFVAERFGQAFDTYVLDVRGRGLSESGADLDYSVEAQAADVSAFAEAMGFSRFSLIGHSMGARIAARMARKGGASLARMVLVDPPVSGPGRRAYPSQLPWYVDSIRLSQAGMSADDMRSFCPTWTDEQLSLRAEWLHTCDERAIKASFEAFHTEDFHADLRHVNCPALLMVAERGGVILDEDIAEIQGLMSNLAVVRVADAGHMIPWDNEEYFYRAFDNFLGASLPSVSGE
ncbi:MULTISPECIES: alpha/beta fold hydrolase [Pseudomonas]|jgi:N-formylmaleamate deformylase|uniref:Alpha/beta hydrolase n=1 Tax=Pseudomonas fluorescens TaxID=294 RepID=A0A0F4U008_PSEFL|nr:MULTISPECIES: alpha/beta hydrolase [Pseudomonas]KJZ49694.1 alpha/beta hydrolase [Pseudomonas fluorescens]MBI3904307.1 alpha/beta hydrolase [Pseudomonas fluorescens]